MKIVVEELADDFNIEMLLKSSSELERIQYSHWRTCNSLSSSLEKLYDMENDFRSFGSFVFKTSDSYLFYILKKYIAARCKVGRKLFVILNGMERVELGNTTLDLLIEEEMNTELVTSCGLYSGDIRIKELESKEREILYGDNFDYYEFEDSEFSNSSMMIFSGEDGVLEDRKRLEMLGKMRFDDIIDCRSCAIESGGVFYKFLVNNFKNVLIGGKTSMYFHLYKL